MPDDPKPEYEVGYGRPPRHSRFEKGRSGNPRGRPPGAKDLKTLLAEALDETVIVAENGGRRKITKRSAIITQFVNRCVKADLRAIKLLLDALRDSEDQQPPVSSETVRFTQADEKVIEQLRARLARPATE
jgi:hypothetical protein